jgi:hypothetical protein
MIFMTSRISWLEFVAGCLATFRLALLIAKEDGPADTTKKLRLLIPPGWMRRGFSCEWCQSFWWGMAIALFFAATHRLDWVDFPLYWLAFSASAIVLNQAFTCDKGRK